LWADIIVMFTPKSVVGPKVLELCIQHNKKFIIDTDDNTFVVDKSNISYEWSGVEDVPGLWTSGIQYDRSKVVGKRAMYEKSLLLCDALTVTQSVLASDHEKYMGQGEIYILPNSLDLTFYKPWKRRHPKEQIRIGWQGGASHIRDLKILEGPLAEINKMDNVQLVFFGQSWPDMKRLYPDAEFHPWVDQDTFHVKLGQLDLDIGLCPIEDTNFNRGKSNLKMLEYGVFGVPSICSKIPSGPYNYTDGTVSGDRILVENTDEAWLNAIESLVKDEDNRKVIGETSRKLVTEAYNIDNTWKYWADCYGEVHQRVVEKPL
jgi:glycosyltransferase involved in cell wall biosynthesis